MLLGLEIVIVDLVAHFLDLCLEAVHCGGDLVSELGTLVLLLGGLVYIMFSFYLVNQVVYAKIRLVLYSALGRAVFERAIFISRFDNVKFLFQNLMLSHQVLDLGLNIFLLVDTLGLLVLVLEAICWHYSSWQRLLRHHNNRFGLGFLMDTLCAL